MISKFPWRLVRRTSSNLSWCLSSFLSTQDMDAHLPVTLVSDKCSQNSYMELSQEVYEAMKECGRLKSMAVARKLHARLVSLGLAASVFLQNHLLRMYFNCGLADDAYGVFKEIEVPNVFSWNITVSGLASCGRIMEAKKLFDEMPLRDLVSWNSMMSGYYSVQEPWNTIKMFVSMFRVSNCRPDQLSFSIAVKACGHLGYLKLAVQLHTLVGKFGLGYDASINSSIIDMYIKCGEVHYAERIFSRMQNPSLFCWNSMIYGYSRSHGVEGALHLFNQMPEHDAISWNTMISVLSQHGRGDESLGMFVEMANKGFKPNSMAYACVLSTCASIGYLDWGMHLHARIARTEPNLDVLLGNGLIDLYVKCGHLEFAGRVFARLTTHNAVSWTSFISGVADSAFQEQALALFRQMRENHIPLDEYIFATVIGVCSGQDYLSSGTQLHSQTIKTGFDSFVPVGNALITMYSRCGDTQMSSRAFDLMPVKDIISWTAMITAFSQCGHIEKARICFHGMPERNVAAWNSMLNAYFQHDLTEDGLKLFSVMRRECAGADPITFASSIRGCADLSAVKLGEQIIAQSEKSGFAYSLLVSNSMITMFSRCGLVEEACKVFDSVQTKNLVSWNSMMAGYAQNGRGREVIKVFKDMLKMDCSPDHISFVSVLSGCSHSGLVAEGTHYFNSMIKDFGISPTYEHYSSMVDLLGRAGLLEQAMDFIRGMTLKPNADIWVALLSACRIHSHVKESKLAGEYAMKNLLELGLEHCKGHVLLANACSETVEFKVDVDVRRLMKKRGIKKIPGCSWIEVNNRVHVFTADGTNHPEMENIRRTLDELMKRMVKTLKGALMIREM